MDKNKLISPNLQTFDYFQKKIPLYLQKSYGYIEHFRLWFNVLTEIVDCAEEIFNMLNIFDEDYEDYIETISPLTSTDNAVLDLIGNLYGVSRYIAVGSNPSVTLNNKQFILYIRIEASKQFCDGSSKSIYENYRRCGLDVKMINKNPAQCGLVLDTTQTNYDNIIRNMFTSGLLTFKSAGIQYSYSVWDGEAE